MEGMSAVVFLTVPDSFSCRSVVSFVVCYDSGCCHILYGEFNECLSAYFGNVKKLQTLKYDDFVAYTFFYSFFLEGVFRVKENSVFLIKSHDNNFGYILYYAFIGRLSICRG